MTAMVGVAVAGATVTGVPGAGELTSMDCPTDLPCCEVSPPVALC